MKTKIIPGIFADRVYWKAWYWPFWTFWKSVDREVAIREYARKINTELRTYDAHRKPNAKFNRVVERKRYLEQSRRSPEPSCDTSSALLTGIIIGNMLGSSHQSSSSGSPKEDTITPGGGTFGAVVPRGRGTAIARLVHLRRAIVRHRALTAAEAFRQETAHE